MNRAEIQAKIALGGLLLIALILLTGGVLYGMLAFWAGGLAALAMSAVAALTVWGLILARQQAALVDDAALSKGAAVAPQKETLGGFRMSYGGESDAIAPQKSAGESRTLEIGFQRVVVALAALCFLIVAGIITYLLTQKLGAVGPGKPMTVSKVPLDNLALLIGVGAAGLFLALHWLTRVTRATVGTGEAINGIFTMGLPGMLAVAVATVAGYFKTLYVPEVSSAIVVLLLILQALELLVNAARSYAGIEEFDQDPVDLEALPLVPMVTSNWIVGMRMLLAQSVGLGRTGARGEEPAVLARMLPRIILASVVLLIGASCFGIVRPGEIAFRERLGRSYDEKADILYPGLHFMAPWPIDVLVRIPVAQIQYASVGADEEMTSVSGKKVSFNFWTIPHSGKESEPDFATGDVPYQLLGGYVGVWWRVSDPQKFYRNLSHSLFLDTTRSGGEGDVERPIYDVIVRAVASKMVTRSFATHTADEILNTDRAGVEADCLDKVQKELNALNSGIEIVTLTIKDVHPPIGSGRQYTAAGPTYGPADAYELMIENREVEQIKVDMAKTYQYSKTSEARGKAYQNISEAQQKATKRVTKAATDTTRISTLLPYFSPENRRVTRNWLMYNALDAVIPNATKVILGRDALPPEIWQGGAPVTPARPPGM